MLMNAPLLRVKMAEYVQTLQEGSHVNVSRDSKENSVIKVSSVPFL